MTTSRLALTLVYAWGIRTPELTYDMPLAAHIAISALDAAKPALTTGSLSE